MAPKSTINKIKMTPEIARQMAGLLPITLDARKRFTPSAYDDSPKDFRPVFILKPMTKLQKQSLAGIAQSGDSAFYALVMECIDTVENFWDVVTMEQAEFTIAHLEAMRGDITGEIVDNVLFISGLSTGEKAGLK